MEIFLLVALGIVGIIFFPRIKNWVKTVHCPYCKKWFCLNKTGFHVTDQVVGSHKRHTGGGGLFRFLGLNFLHRTYVRDDPFIREWGTEHYNCRSCGQNITIANVKRDR